MTVSCMARLSVRTWRLLLGRWCPMQSSPEVDLIIWLLATSIADEPGEAIQAGREPFKGGFFATGFHYWCAAVRLDGQFVLEQVRRAAASAVELPQQGRGVGWA